jgi:hypothetical protein
LGKIVFWNKCRIHPRCILQDPCRKVNEIPKVEHVSQHSPVTLSVRKVRRRGLTSTQWNVYNTDTKCIRGFSPCFQFITYEKHYLFIVVVIVRYVFC